jgi:hypothetical protein
MQWRADIRVLGARYLLSADVPAAHSGGDATSSSPGQAVNLATAIGAYITGGAFADFCEQHRGSLAPARLPT